MSPEFEKHDQVHFLPRLFTWVIKIQLTYCHLDFCYEMTPVIEPHVE